MICSFVDSSGEASGPIKRCIFIGYIIKTIIKLEENIMVLDNVTKFHKILTKSIRFRERTSLRQTYVCKVRTERGNT